MKVLHVIDALGLGGGAEQALVSQLPRLRDLGVDSSVVCLYPRKVGLFREAERLGFDVTVLTADRWPTRVWQLRRHIDSVGPDLVHASLLHSCFATRFALIGKQVAQINSLVNTTYDPMRVESLGLSRWRLRMTRIFDGWTARHLGGHFHALTEVVADEAREQLLVDNDRITVIPRGRDKALLEHRSAGVRTATRDALGLDTDSVVVLTVGRQDLQKAQTDLVRAVAQARLLVPGLELLIAGRDGAASNAIKNTIDEVDAAEFVRVLGHRTDVPDLIAAADVFALPSVYEGLGSVLIEAMAIGTPIVGSDAPAIAEVLGGGSFGSIAARGDIDELTNALVCTVQQDHQTALRVSAAREQFTSLYEIDCIAEATVALYARIAGTTVA